MKHPIPAEALKRHTAILGMTGSGKSSTGRLLVEEVVDQGHRVCILDTIKSDWWGITSSRSGKSPGLPFKILGGPRGHLPLHSSAGKPIGQLVGSGKLPLSIIDMSDFEAGGLQRFFIDFVPALMRSMKGVVYLVIEEAHEVAPKERAGFSGENMAIHFAKKLGTGGRTKGIRLVVLTQRVQALHNAVLGSCETVIAHRIGYADDQVPVLKWMKAKVGKDNGAIVEQELANLPDGVGFLASGAPAQIFERVKFPLFATYDNTATPDQTDTERTIKTAPVDPEQLRAIIGDALKEAEANDPAALRKTIADLQAQLKKPAPKGELASSQTQLAQEHRRGLVEGKATGTAEGYQRGLRETAAAYHAFGKQLALIKTAFDLKYEVVVEQNISRAKVIDEQIQKSGQPTVTANLAVDTPKREPAAATPAPRAPSPVAGGDGSLTNPQLALLKALAWWKHMGHAAPSRPQLAAIAGWKPSGSNLKDRLSELSKAGLVDYPQKGFVSLTDAGAGVAPAPDLAQTLICGIKSVLTGPQTKLFEALLDRPGAVGRPELAEALGWEPQGSNLKDRLSELSRLEIVTYPERGSVALQDWVVTP